MRADLDAYYQRTSGQKPELVLTEEEEKAGARTPSWKMTLLEMQSETAKRPEPPENLHWHYAFEAMNLIDGKRSVLDIYRVTRAAALSAGTWYYGPVELADITQFLEGMEKAGAITILRK
jgi:hypothetical protein